jgi:hypothetical protein
VTGAPAGWRSTPRSDDGQTILGTAQTADSGPYDLHVWSGWRDSNPRPPAPKAGALTKLRYIPCAVAHARPTARSERPTSASLRESAVPSALHGIAAMAVRGEVNRAGGGVARPASPSQQHLSPIGGKHLAGPERIFIGKQEAHVPGNLLGPDIRSAPRGREAAPPRYPARQAATPRRQTTAPKPHRCRSQPTTGKRRAPLV